MRLLTDIRRCLGGLGAPAIGSLAAALLSCSCASRVSQAQPPERLNCAVFPADNLWNTPIDRLPVDANSAAFIATIGPDKPVHPDFASGTWHGIPIGIPYVLVPGSQPKLTLKFEYSEESDPGPYPIPPAPPIEGGNDSKGDRHIIIIDKDNCVLYELYSAYQNPDGSWRAGSGAVYDLNSNKLRPAGRGSADAAGLSVFAGLVRYDEVASGEIRHALRFTVPRTRREFIWPASHYASNLTGQQYPPMGQRFRLKASFDLSGYSKHMQIILRALQKYGMFLADNGSAWFLSGVPDPRWDQSELGELKRVRGADFEAVDEFSLRIDNSTAQVRPR
jgi:hypothetical protein